MNIYEDSKMSESLISFKWDQYLDEWYFKYTIYRQSANHNGKLALMTAF